MTRTLHRHTPRLREALTENLKAFTRVPQAREDLRSAAVAVTVVPHQGEAVVVATRRQSKLSDHSGQWALPGGRVDEGEDVLTAARRELHEEVALEVGNDDVIGLLDDYITRSGYVISPVVIWSQTPLEALVANPDEVASIHPFSFPELCRTDSPNLERIPESDREVLSMNYLDDVIYAPTAAMLYQFREVAILGRATRVLDYDQPVFAWR